MPKERVRSRYHRDNGFEHYQEKTSDDYFVQVGWQKSGGYVEVSTVNPKGSIGIPGQAEQPDYVDPGWFVSLDRQGINDLIKKLRKARDDAFGRDE